MELEQDVARVPVKRYRVKGHRRPIHLDRPAPSYTTSPVVITIHHSRTHSPRRATKELSPPGG
jgi:hypothetical protein